MLHLISRILRINAWYFGLSCLLQRYVLASVGRRMKVIVIECLVAQTFIAKRAGFVTAPRSKLYQNTVQGNDTSTQTEQIFRPLSPWSKPCSAAASLVIGNLCDNRRVKVVSRTSGRLSLALRCITGHS